MEGFLTLLGLGLVAAVIGIPIAAFVALSRTGTLQRTMAELELKVRHLHSEMQVLQRRLDAGPAPTPVVSPSTSAPIPAEAPATPGIAARSEPMSAIPAAPLVAAATSAPPAMLVANDRPERTADYGANLATTDVAMTAEVAAPDDETALPIEDVSEKIAGALPDVDAARPMQPAAVDVAGLEERLGGRLFIWIGGLAIALAGAFLFKYSIDQGWLGPKVRCAAGAALGIALLGGGEWMRSREGRVAQSLSAAGVAVLYATLFATIRLYEILDPAGGFLLLAGLTGGAIALALRQGPFVGLLGLSGGFITPAIVSTGKPHALVLFGYLFAIQLGSQVLSRRRGWWWSSAVAVAGGFLWAAGWLVYQPRDWGQDLWPALFLLATCAATAWAQRGVAVPTRLEAWRPVHWQAPLTNAIALLLMTGLTAAAGYDFHGWLFFGLLAAGQLVLARIRAEQEALTWIAAGLAALLLLGWPLWADVFTADTGRFIGVALSIGGLLAVGSFAALWGARQPVRWALLSVLSTATFFLIAYARLRGLEGLPSWGLISLILAAPATLAAAAVARHRAADHSYEESLGVYALAACGFIAFAIPLELEHAWIAVGWALLLPAIAVIESRLHIAWFRYAAWVAGGLVLARLLPGPWVVGFEAGTTPIFNWLLYGYGIPLVAFAAASWVFRRERDDGLVIFLEAGIVAIAFLLVTLELHHYFQGGLLYRFDFGLVEVTGFAVAWLLIAAGLARAARLDPRPARLWGMRIVTGLAAIVLIGGSLVAVNPLFSSEPVGEWPLVNWLPYAYALPALLLAAVAREIEVSARPALAIWLQGLAGVVGLLFVSLEIRQLFQGPVLILGEVGLAELSCMIIAWLLIALGLLRLLAGARQGHFQAMGRAVAALAVATLVLGSLLAVNPLLGVQDVGAWPLLNWLIPAYAVPALLVTMLARDLQDAKRAWIALALASLALLLGFAFVTLEIRQWFQGSRLDDGGVGDAENYAYSVGWILYGVALLMAGILRGGVALRWASLAVVVLAVAKVFLFDASQLTGLYRVASFLGLGFSLMAIGYVYQRVVFRRPAGPLAPITPPPTRS